MNIRARRQKEIENQPRLKKFNLKSNLTCNIYKNLFSLKFGTDCYFLLAGGNSYTCAHKISQNSKKRILQDPSLET